MIDRTVKRDKRENARKKVRPVHGRSLIHVMNAIAKRAKKVALDAPQDKNS